MTVQALLEAADTLRDTLAPMRFAAPVAHVYNPLDYAFAPYADYVSKFANGPKRGLFLGMNPGPFGMMQTGVPFGEVAAVRDWMGVRGEVLAPEAQHPKRPIQGFACTRSEVSGRRVWAWAAQTYGSAEVFFSEFFVLNYCPLIWLESSGKNRTPEQLPAAELTPVYAACDAHLTKVIQILAPQYAIGVGGFAEKRFRSVIAKMAHTSTERSIKIGSILHPSPASPAANRGWAEQAQAQLNTLLAS
jgi:single-strand selective monofunctional uracil DNA glycosylase